MAEPGKAVIAGRAGKPCSVCRHPLVEQINGDLLYEDSLHALERRYGVHRFSLRNHRDATTGHIRPIGDKDRETARAASAIRAWERAKVEMPLIVAREAKRLAELEAQRNDAQIARLQQERFNAARLGAEKREMRLQETDERLAQWGKVLDTLTDEVKELATKNGGKLLAGIDTLMLLLDRGVKISQEVRALMMAAAEHGGELHAKSLSISMTVTAERIAASPEWQDLARETVDALTAHPEALTAVLARWTSRRALPAASAEVVTDGE